MTSMTDRAHRSLRASNTTCLIDTFHAYLHVFLAQPTQLHLSRPVLHTTDIRLHDYTQRLFLFHGCGTQLIRSCHAARHTAWQFGQWTLTHDEKDVGTFVRDNFGEFADTEVVQQMIDDGRRLGWIHNICQNGYVSYLLASDWARYGRLSNTQLTLLANDFLVAPTVAQIMPLLSPIWLDQSLAWYHHEVLAFRSMTVVDQHLSLGQSVLSCWMCPGSIMTPTDASCVGCHRRGTRCAAECSPSHWSVFVRGRVWHQVSRLAAKFHPIQDTVRPAHLDQLAWTTAPLSEEVFSTMLSQRLDYILEATDSAEYEPSICAATVRHQRRATWG